MTKRVIILLLCATALLTGTACSVNLPVPNGSFEDVVYREGWNEPGTSYPFPATYVGWPPYLQTVAIPNAFDGQRALRIDSTDSYQYAWGNSGDSGMTYRVQPNSVYTLKVRVAKVPGYANTGGYLRLMIVPVRGLFENVGAYVETDIPAQTLDGAWTQYSAVFNSTSYPQLVGYYFLISCFAWGSAGHGQYGGGGPPCQLYFDGLTLDGPAMGIRGTVTLGDWSPADPDKRLTPIKIELSPQGSGTAKTEVVVLNPDSSYNVFCEPGTYDIAFTAAGWLKKLVSGVVVGSLTQVDAALINGDVDGNNHIGTPDFSILFANFDKAGD